MGPLILLLMSCAASTPEEERETVSACADTDVLDDEGACVPAACGTTRWPGVEDGPPVVYVDATAASGGDGSEAAPYVGLAEALAQVAGGTRILLAAGTYGGVGAVAGDPDEITVAGRCADLVTVDGADVAEGEAALRLGGSTRDKLAVSGLTVRNGPNGGLAVTGGTLRVTDVRLAENVGSGLVAMGDTAGLDLARVEVLDSAVDASRAGGTGLFAAAGADVRWAEGAVLGSAEAGIYAADAGTLVELEDVDIVDTNGGPRGDGFGIEAKLEAEVVATRVAVVRATEVGVLADGATVTLTDATITDTRPTGSGKQGRGIGVEGAGNVTMVGGELRGNGETGAWASGRDVVLRLEGVTVADTHPDADGVDGHGVYVGDEARLELVDASVEGCTATGVWVDGEGTGADVSGTTITGTLPGAGDAGYGILASEGASVVVRDTDVLENHRIGVAVDGATFEMSGGTVAGTIPGLDDIGGRGLEARGGGHVLLVEVAFSENREAGILAGDTGTTLDAEDVRIEHIAPGTTYRWAAGISAQEGAVVTARGLSVNDIEGAGLIAVLSGALSCEGCVAEGNAVAGAVAIGGGALALDACGLDDNGAVGVYANGADGAPTVSLVDTDVGAHPYAAAWFSGSGSYTIDGGTLVGGPGVEAGGRLYAGDAVYGEWIADASALRITGATLLDATGAGVFLHHASATLEGLAASGNTLDLRQQGCADAMALATDAWAASSVICPDADRLVVPLEFEISIGDATAQE